MQATARRLSVVTATSTPRRRLIRVVRPTSTRPVYPESTIRDYLLDADGSSRDITFTPVNQDRMIAFLEVLRVSHQPDSLRDSESEDVLPLLGGSEWSRMFTSDSGYLHGCWSSAASPLPRLQTFIDWDAGGYCLEISYFPQDVDAESFSVSGFRELIEGWRATLGASDYFVRYENASWGLYDPAGLGVFYTNLRQPLP